MTTMSESTFSAPPRILLVEDDLDQAHLLRFLLEDDGRYQVTLAQDGVRGSELAARGGWALVITDLNLPGAYGMTVVEASRVAHPDVPILATTGYSGPEYADEALERGADEVLLKPLDRDEFLARVSVLIRKGGPPTAGPDQEGASDVEGTTARGSARERSSPPLQVLAVGLHPGDVEAGVGGTLLRHLDRGDRVMTVVTGAGLADPEGRKAALGRTRTASRKLGARCFMGTARTHDLEEFKDDVYKLLSGVLAEVRPDLLYLPTPNQEDGLASELVDVALEVGPDISPVFCFEAGEATQQFQPQVFIPLGEHLERKLEILVGLDPPEDSAIHPDRVELAARGWARRAGEHPAEALEALHGGEPWSGATQPEGAP